jgi:hypothetical protein
MASTASGLQPDPDLAQALHELAFLLAQYPDVLRAVQIRMLHTAEVADHTTDALDRLRQALDMPPPNEGVYGAAPR